MAAENEHEELRTLSEVFVSHTYNKPMLVLQDFFHGKS